MLKSSRPPQVPGTPDADHAHELPHRGRPGLTEHCTGSVACGSVAEHRLILGGDVCGSGGQRLVSPTGVSTVWTSDTAGWRNLRSG